MVLGMDFIVNLLNRCVWGMGRLTLNKREASRYDIDRDILVTKVTAGRSNDLVDSDRCDFRWRMPPTCLVSMLSSHQRLHFIYDQYNCPRAWLSIPVHLQLITLEISDGQVQEYELSIWKIHLKMSSGESYAILPRVLWSKEISSHPYDTELIE